MAPNLPRNLAHRAAKALGTSFIIALVAVCCAVAQQTAPEPVLPPGKGAAQADEAPQHSDTPAAPQTPAVLYDRYIKVDGGWLLESWVHKVTFSLFQPYGSDGLDVKTVPGRGA